MKLNEFFAFYKLEKKWLASRLSVTSRTTLANYISGFSNPSDEVLEEIEKEIHRIGDELKKVKISRWPNEYKP